MEIIFSLSVNRLLKKKLLTSTYPFKLIRIGSRQEYLVLAMVRTTGRGSTRNVSLFLVDHIAKCDR